MVLSAPGVVLGVGVGRGICVDNLGDGVGVGLGRFGILADSEHPPFGQRISHPPCSKYIATHTENTKNPKTLGKLLTQVNLTSHIRTNGYAQN